MEDIPRKGKQPKLDDRDTRKRLRSVEEKKDAYRMSLLCLIRIDNRPFLNELFRELRITRYFKKDCTEIHPNSRS